MKNILLCACAFFSFSVTTAQNIIDIPVVVHVLYRDTNDSIPASIIQTVILDSLNADFRRRNADTVNTQTAYKPIAADTEIQFHFAEIDPFGNPTQGITWKYTDSLYYDWNHENMKFDSTGGSQFWDDCRYLNIWVCNMGGVNAENSKATFPWDNSKIKGVVCYKSAFTSLYPKIYRLLTHETGHFLGLRPFISGFSCVDNDWIGDTPIQPHITGLCLNSDSILEETVCQPLPLGRLSCNYIGTSGPAFLKCQNMFTIGQKEYMHQMIAQYLPGLSQPWFCGTGINETNGIELEVYPNPAATDLTIKTTTAGNIAYSIYDISGRLLQSGRFVQSKRVDVSGLAEGVYLILVETEDGVVSRKFVKQKE